jgi:hypothetical protein
LESFLGTFLAVLAHGLLGTMSCSCNVQEAVFARKMCKELKESWQRKRCTRQFALIVGKNVTYHLSPTAADQFIAESAIRREGPQGEDFRLS